MSSSKRTSTTRCVSASLAIGLSLAATGCGGGGSGGGGGGGGAPTTVSAVSPAAGATGVPTNTQLNATFGRAMTSATITETTFKVTGPGTTAVSGDVSYLDNVATFEPSSPLAGDTLYTATITTGATAVGGAPLASDFVWTFRTGVTADTTPPTVVFTVPARGATGVATNSRATATFNEAMDPATIKTASFVLASGASASGPVTYADGARTATLTPNQDLLVSTEYTATLTTAVRDLSGNALSIAYVWTFTTGSGRDTSEPSVIGTNPDDGDTGVSRDKRINATFNEAMDPATISTLTYELVGPNSSPVAGTVSYDAPSRVATFVPTALLAANTLYTATIRSTVQDAAGNSLGDDEVWSFTTGAANAVQGGQLPVDLRSAGNFAVLAGTTITNTGQTVINGNVGLAPGSAITGFPPGVINGTQHVANPTADVAKVDLTTAYTDAQGRSTNPIAMPGNLGGLTLAPGLYVRATDVLLSGTGANGILTLDAQGDSTAVWIFQCKAAFATTPGTSIVLAGGAKASNIFWAVGSTAVLETTTTFFGTILAEAAINVRTGATITGRTLVRSGEVTFEANTVTLPSP